MSSLSLWSRRDPFADLDATFNALARNFLTPTASPSRALGFTPAADLRRDGDDAVIRLELPGVDIDNDVTVEIENGRLVVRGERRDEHIDEQQGYRLREMRYGSFARSFTLPAHIASDAINASYDAGVLTVRVAGAYAGSTPQRIAVTAASAPTAAATADATGTTTADTTATDTGEPA